MRTSKEVSPDIFKHPAGVSSNRQEKVLPITMSAYEHSVLKNTADEDGIPMAALVRQVLRDGFE